MWKDIKNYEGLYQVNELGDVKSLISGKILKPFYSGKNYDKGKGYATISLWKDCKRNNKYIHRLVAETFIPNPNNYSEVNHIDENTRNNKEENLEWCDRIYNVNYGSTKERMIEAQHNKPIAQYDLNNQLIKVYNSHSELKKGGYPPSSITKYIKENKTYKGYKFVYAV